jgi:hypothetical protein
MPWRRIGGEIIASYIINLGPELRWVVSFTPRLLYPRKKKLYPLDSRLGGIFSDRQWSLDHRLKDGIQFWYCPREIEKNTKTQSGNGLPPLFEVSSQIQTTCQFAVPQYLYGRHVGKPHYENASLTFVDYVCIRLICYSYLYVWRHSSISYAFHGVVLS